MTLVDQAEELALLAERAGAAAVESTSDAALATVLERLKGAEAFVSPYGVRETRWINTVPTEARKQLSSSAKRAADAVRPLSTAPDEVLASYARSGDAATRGALAAVRRDAVALGEALLEAQDALVAAWADSLWPDDRTDELEILTLVPETASAAKAVARVHDELRSIPGHQRMLSSAALARMQAELAEAQAVVEQLEHAHVPDDVLEFWTALSDGTEQPLTILSAGVLQWLVDHGGTSLFTVRRRDE